MKPEKFYKLARPDGWDFYTRKTINYRDNVGKEVVCPEFNSLGKLCSNAFIHASRTPDQCFVGAKIPCSAFEVSGVPVKEDTDKCGFQKLIVEKELISKDLFEWNYELACNPVNPFKLPPPEISPHVLQLLKEWDSVWASVWDSVGERVWDSVGDSVGDSVWASVGDSVGDSVWASVGAYVGHIFSPCIKKWKYVEHPIGQYPFQPAVDLWNMGLVASYEGKIWRLHGGEKGKVLYEGKGEGGKVITGTTKELIKWGGES